MSKNANIEAKKNKKKPTMKLLKIYLKHSTETLSIKITPSHMLLNDCGTSTTTDPQLL